MTTDYEYHQSKKPEKTYISKSLSLNRRKAEKSASIKSAGFSRDPFVCVRERRACYPGDRRRPPRDRCEVLRGHARHFHAYVPAMRKFQSC